MKKLNILLISILFTTLFLNAFGEVKTTALKVEISGKGKQAIVFIPNFACWGDVWNATRSRYVGRYTCCFYCKIFTTHKKIAKQVDVYKAYLLFL